MIKYLLISIKIDISKLTKIFFEKIVLYFDMLANIVNNENSLFIKIFNRLFVIKQRLIVDLTSFFIFKQMIK